MPVRTCVTPTGKFIYGIHRPEYDVDNLRKNNEIKSLGKLPDGTDHKNSINFPMEDIHIQKADTIFEIPNAFPFKGTTYIQKRWADEKASNISSISLNTTPRFSWTQILSEWAGQADVPLKKINKLWDSIPEAIQLTIASTSSDKNDLIFLAKKVCEFVYDDQYQPLGLKYHTDKKGRVRPLINHPIIFESLVNNPYLPDSYKEAMVLRPGVQGNSPIVGEFCGKSNSHVYEYLRANSYIPWGHYAANMANDSIRYDIQSLQMEDITGMRHLFYQRIYIHLARQLNISLKHNKQTLSNNELENLRKRITNKLEATKEHLNFDCNLWGWNFGFDYTPNHYRLHASHQQIHQQYAMIPKAVPTEDNSFFSHIQSYACGDLVADFIRQYYQETGHSFFEDYVQAIKTNRRIDSQEEGPHELIIYSDEHVMIFVPKAQTSQWEIQIMPLQAIGNILEADTSMRQALDRALYITAKVLASLNAKLVTHIEYASRFSPVSTDQRLIIAFLPRMPESPGAFSEAQLRWINGHYPEDFAAACRSKLPDILETLNFST
ncbi:hypothetical protein MHK_004942 [Candidatus Magnetomorum sp. HK-1]|nr:hypothetical protein MHK_004942 [Candidatus Magnetomorum sp. HK-1]